MTTTKMIFILLPMFMLACTLTAQSAAATLSTARQTIPTTPVATLNVLRICQVKTGIETGNLNLRTCGGTHCSVAAILHEGETLTRTQSRAVDGWIPVRNAGGLEGWANSKYLTCEETK
jgi:uncharacterized protein YgiM (DUF1202 family)